MNISALFDISGKTALVTGGNSGIGEAMGRALGLAGAYILLAARRKEALAHAVEHMRKDGIQADSLAADLSSPEKALACGKAALDTFGPVDILINAAGVNMRQPFMEVGPTNWATQINLHLSAPFFLTQVLAPGMARRGWGRIINIASLQSFRAFADSAPYGAGKGGVVQLTRAIAQEWSGRGVTCNAVGPGFFPTALTRPVFDNPELAGRNAAQTCIGRNGTLEDLYGCTVFLASEASAYITGQVIMIDGGFTAR